MANAACFCHSHGSFHSSTSPTEFGPKARSTRRCGNPTIPGNATASWPQRRSFWTTRPSMGPPLRTTMPGDLRQGCPCLTFLCNSSRRHRLPRCLTGLCAPAALSWHLAPIIRLPRLPTRSTYRHSRRTTTHHHHLTWSSSLHPRQPMEMERRHAGLAPASHLQPRPLQAPSPVGLLRQASLEALHQVGPVAIGRRAKGKPFHHHRHLPRLGAPLSPVLWRLRHLQCTRPVWTTEPTTWNFPRHRRHQMLRWTLQWELVWPWLHLLRHRPCLRPMGSRQPRQWSMEACPTACWPSLRALAQAKGGSRRKKGQRLPP